MGYGHQRTAFPLRELAKGSQVVRANDYVGIPSKDRQVWENTRRFYEFISGFKQVLFFGWLVFSLFDQLQKIFSFYPRQELISANFQVKQIISLIKKGWGKDLIKKINSPAPLVSTFFTPAFMAEIFDYAGKIFCVVCDTDVSRTWVTNEPQKSRINYFVPTERVFERLKTYGVKKENIFFTGYPLPMENIGENEEIVKRDLKCRLANLDPEERYAYYYGPLIQKYLGDLPESLNRPLTILFSVGGAGAQKDIGAKIIKSLAQFIRSGNIKLILSVGTKVKNRDFFSRYAKRFFREKSSENFEIIFDEDIENYFKKFNEALRRTDILWTKPSELSFYAALGLPIIIAPPIGSQEEFNMRWLVKSGFGIMQEDPSYCHQWLFDWLQRGYLAEAAMQGFIEGERFGVMKIKSILER